MRDTPLPCVAWGFLEQQRFQRALRQSQQERPVCAQRQQRRAAGGVRENCFYLATSRARIGARDCVERASGSLVKEVK